MKLIILISISLALAACNTTTPYPNSAYPNGPVTCASYLGTVPLNESSRAGYIPPAYPTTYTQGPVVFLRP